VAVPTKDEFAGSRMKSIGADDEIEISDAAVLEAYLQTRFRCNPPVRSFGAASTMVGSNP